MDEKWLALGVALLIAGVSLMSYAKPAEESQAWVQCMKKLDYLTQRFEDSLQRTNRCHYFGQPCKREWRKERVDAQFPTYIVMGNATVNESNRLAYPARQQAEKCLEIMDNEGLE